MNSLIVGIVLSIIGFLGVGFSSLFFGLLTVGIYLILYSVFAERSRRRSQQTVETDTARALAS